MGVKRVDNIPLWQCDECGKTYINKYEAELCHKEYFCEDCGKKCKQYMLVCDECYEKRKYDRATKLTYEEYLKKYPRKYDFL